jgi:hypothetical protein
LRSFRFAVFVLALFTAFVVQGRRAHAESQQWPGKLLLGLQPLGTQVTLVQPGLDANAFFKSNLDFAGRVYEGSAISLWIGGELGVGGREHLAFVEPGLFTRVTFEKLLHIPLVPFVQLGVTGSAYVGYADNLTATVGFIGGKVGGGVDYYLTRRIALGMQTDFAFGSVIATGNGRTQTEFAAYWDLTAGMRFAL